MTDAHQILAEVVVALTFGLLGAAVWSFLEARRTADARDHRFAVDRLVLAVVGVVAINDAIGGAWLVTGSRPADPLHLLYGVAALVTLPLGWLLGGRRDRQASGTPRPSRRRRDAWLIAATVVLLGVELRLFATG